MARFILFILLFSSHLIMASDDSTLLNSKELNRPKYCKARIIGMSPNKIISLGYDYEFGQTLNSSGYGVFDPMVTAPVKETTRYKYVSGFRFSAKAPIINKPKIIWQFGLNYWSINYKKDYSTSTGNYATFGTELKRLTTAGINTSVYKPLNAKNFLIFQLSTDLNGDYTLGKPQGLKYLRYSGVVMYGKRVHDRKQWALGLSRGYNAGQAIILPVLMYNYTSPNKKSGFEIMLPARAWYRFTVNKNSLFRAGFELEGASYHIGNTTLASSELDLKRGQLRFKTEYQCKLYKSFWIAFQAGYCKVLNSNLGFINADGKDITYQFQRDEPMYAMINKLSDFMFFNVSFNFVSF